jgi:hypothetical protein
MKKKLRVYQEDIKAQHTAHWDWDYLTWEEIDQRLKAAGVGQDEQMPPPKAPRKRPGLKRGIWIGIGMLVMAVLILAFIVGHSYKLP